VPVPMAEPQRSQVPAQVSVIVRAKDKVDTIGATLSALRRQTVPAEIVVVDSGSTDGTLGLARQWADQVIELPPGEFSYGRALNIGAASATCGIHAALSAHCVPLTDTWLADSLRYYRRPDVAATNQADNTPTGQPIRGSYFQSLHDAAVNPGWGFSNHASTWLAEVWHEFPFREDLGACEDKEWSWRVLAAGRTIAYAPSLSVPTVHRRSAGLGPLVDRLSREAETMVSLGAADPLPASAALAAWWSSFPTPGRRPRIIRRANPYRMAELLGSWRGGRRARPLSDSSFPKVLAEAGLERSTWAFMPWS
jgi:rhamnosyltransferase